MKEYPCPACGAPVRFQSAVSVFSVCPYCSQMLVRRDLDIEAIGKQAILQEDSSPLQLGTSGRFEKRRFTLVGRLRQEWSGGAWSEWYALFDDGTQGWLGEAQGFYMMSFEKPDAGALPTADQLKAGHTIRLAGTPYAVEDIKAVTCAGSQGELPFRAPHGRKSTSVDLVGQGKSFAGLDYSDEGTRVYVGKYVEFDELAFENLRQLDGW